MCGLTFAYFPFPLYDSALGPTEIIPVEKALEHRGIYTTTGVHTHAWGVHTRLPIVGLDKKFDAPYIHDGRAFYFVGEIVNYKELCPDAESDVECLARMWAEHGYNCVKMFDGFWSFVVYNLHSHCAFVVTDFLAKKPLYYRTDRFAVSSEIRGLAPLGPLTPDPVYLSSIRKQGYHYGDRTWAKEVRKMPPGCLMFFQPKATRAAFAIIDPIEAVHGLDLRYEVVRSIQRHFTSSDVPVGLLLSGGLDSSIIYTYLKDRTESLRLYHVDNGQEEWDEFYKLTGAAGNAATFVSLDEYPIDDILRVNEGPVDLGSMIPQYALGKAIKERVVLSGDGADELFGGYRRMSEYDAQGSDVFEELVYYHLPRLDKMMMNGTIELRCPFLGRKVVEGALALPYADRKNKRWLREAFADVLPHEIAYGTKRPLKSREVLSGGLTHSRRLCDIFERMIHERR